MKNNQSKNTQAARRVASLVLTYSGCVVLLLAAHWSAAQSPWYALAYDPDPRPGITGLSRRTVVDPEATWYKFGTNAYYNDGNVGVGISSPIEKLDVVGNIRSNGTLQAYGSGLNGSSLQKFVLYANTTNGLYFDAPKDASGNKLNVQFNWRGGGTPGLFIEGATGNVGIGTGTPAAKLELGSPANSIYSLILRTDNAGRGQQILTQDYIYQSTGSALTVGLGNGSGNVDASIQAWGDGKSTPQDLLLQPQGGNVGIGTSNPVEMLEVAGNIKTTGTLQVAQFGLEGTGDEKFEIFANGIGGVHIAAPKIGNSKMDMEFGWQGGGSAALMLDGSTGNVGVGGTVNPEEQLHVIGNVKADAYKFQDGTELTSEMVSSLQNGQHGGMSVNTDLMIDGHAMTVAGAVHIAHEESLDSAYNSYDYGHLKDQFLLWVERGIVSEDFILRFSGYWNANDWPDYVFKKGYSPASLEEIEDFVAEHGHLPEVPSREEVAKRGYSMAVFNMLLLKKIEELTLYTIEQGKQINELRESLSNLSDK